jgi:hypothetical protein
MLKFNESQYLSSGLSLVIKIIKCHNIEKFVIKRPQIFVCLQTNFTYIGKISPAKHQWCMKKKTTGGA